MQSLASILRNGLRVPNINSAHAGYMFGKGLYFNDCFSKALLSSFSNKRQKNERVYVILCEVALGDMHYALAPNQFSKAPIYCHSIYGVGQYKPNN
jgi:poly [ADP-ribose] polymerase